MRSNSPTRIRHPPSPVGPLFHASIRFDTPRKSATQGVLGSSYTSLGDPTCWTFPSLRTAIRSDMVRASSWSWVT